MIDHAEYESKIADLKKLFFEEVRGADIDNLASTYNIFIQLMDLYDDFANVMSKSYSKMICLENGGPVEKLRDDQKTVQRAYDKIVYEKKDIHVQRDFDDALLKFTEFEKLAYNFIKYETKRSFGLQSEVQELYRRFTHHSKNLFNSVSKEIYPMRHRQLLKKVEEAELIIKEFYKRQVEEFIISEYEEINILENDLNFCISERRYKINFAELEKIVDKIEFKTKHLTEILSVNTKISEEEKQKMASRIKKLCKSAQNHKAILIRNNK